MCYFLTPGDNNIDCQSQHNILSLESLVALVFSLHNSTKGSCGNSISLVHEIYSDVLFIIQNDCAPEPDNHLTVTRYERTAEQDDQLGLSDMKTENYLQTRYP